ncbi:MAG: hypothetical protein M3R58_12265 [Pseudomonadota bacterium]|nr:hypothetical protein [Pseudomonadota bacterium]
MNVRFGYLYRDAGNFKRFGSVIFAVDGDVDLAALRNEIRGSLIDSGFFVAEEVGIPRLAFETHVRHLDHGWHEVEDISWTEEAATGGRFPYFLARLARSTEGVKEVLHG